jgi:hypothetical protein
VTRSKKVLMGAIAGFWLGTGLGTAVYENLDSFWTQKIIHLLLGPANLFLTPGGFDAPRALGHVLSTFPFVLMGAGVALAVSGRRRRADEDLQATPRANNVSD